MTPPGLTAGTVLAVGVTGALALIVLYLVGRRATRIVVPFAGPWLQAPSDRHTGRWAHRLRRVGSLALQLVILAAILVPATAWFGDGRDAAGAATSGRTIALVIDRSASMQARDQAGTRMDRARDAATEIVGGLAPDDRAVIVAFAADAVARTGLEHDHGRLAAAVAAIQASDEPGNLPAALDFAATLLRGQPRPTLIIVGDGGGGDVQEPAAVAAVRDVDLRFVAVGGRATDNLGDNLAILAFSARRQPGDPSSADLSLVVASFRAADSEIDVAITAGPQRIPVARQHLHIPARARVARTLLGVPVPDARFEAQLEHAGDDLPLDDRAFAVVPEAARLSVMAIGTPDLYLDGALLSLGASVSVEHVAPAALESSRSRWPAADVVIFHGMMPGAPPAGGGRFLYLDPTGAHSPWRGAATSDGELHDPIVTVVAREHPLVRGISLTDLNVLAAHRLTPGPGDTVVVAAGRAPLLIARDRPRARAAALAFDPRRSDLPMRSAFPLLLANTLTWLAQRPDPEALSWPTGRTVQVGRPGTAIALEHVGFFDVGDHDSPGGVARVAANLASAEESALAPHAELRIGDRLLARPDPPAPVPRRRPRPTALALLLALGLCTAEWLTFHRRLTV